MHIDQFLDYLKFEKAYSVHTVSAYRRDILSFCTFVNIQAMGEQQVQLLDIRAWMSELSLSGIQPRSINRKLSAVKSYYRFLVRVGVVTSDPFKLQAAMKVKKNLQVPFSKAEVRNALSEPIDLDNFNSVRDRLIIELLYITGIRRDELIRLKFVDVDLTTNMIKVIGKRNKERYIPILASSRQLIQQYLVLRPVRATESVDTLLVTEKGREIYPSMVYRVVNTYFRKVSSKLKVSPHILRHTYATHLLDAGADLNAVKELLGHASLSSTQVYTHMTMEKLKEVHLQAHPRNRG